MRNITKEGLDLICKYEGFSPNIYICPAGYETIGYGHLVTQSNKNLYLKGVTKDEALNILKIDVLNAQKSVLRLINVPISDGQFDALVSFTFNLGAGALQRSSLRSKVNREEHELVPEEFLKWVWAGGKKLNGLINRRKEEANMYSK